MATTKSRHQRNSTVEPRSQVESPREITNDMIEYMKQYAKENPGYAALTCIGVGFILGWKLKPW
jgi:hypothetical protein